MVINARPARITITQGSALTEKSRKFFITII
jgi:hypothetical protein